MTTPKSTHRTIRRALIATATVLIAGLATAGVLILAGVAPLGGGTTHPPCDELPSASQAQAALTANPKLTTQITDQGPGITVRVDSPGCRNKDQSLIEVTYKTDEERDRIHNVLTTADGFGVPVYLHRK